MININKKQMFKASAGSQALATVLIPFALATDIVLMPAYVIGLGIMLSPKGSSGSSSTYHYKHETSNPIINKPYTPSTLPRTTINRTPSASMPSANPRVRQMQQFKR